LNLLVSYEMTKTMPKRKLKSIPHSVSNYPANTRRRNLTEQVVETLQQSIVTGKLRPNERLVEWKIAEMLGVSRTPVREALKLLEITGYAKILPNGGVVVSDDSASHVRSLYEIREALETMAIKLACQRATEDQVNQVEECYNRMVEAINSKDAEKYLESHFDFHVGLCAGCGNERLLSLIRWFRYQYFDRRLARVFHSRDWGVFIKDHKTVLEALMERNPRRAERAVHRDFKNGQRRALKRL